MRRTRCYIAGPISKGDVEQNVRNACNAFTELGKAGYAPFAPQLTCYLQGPVASVSAGFEHDEWMAMDLPWVEVADCVLRLPGESVGADMEVEHARLAGVPVFYSISELVSKNYNRRGYVADDDGE